MDYRDLKNYGIPLNQSMREAESLPDSRTRRKALAIVWKRLGIVNLLRFFLAIPRERVRIAGLDLSAVRFKGLTDEHFIGYSAERTAFFAAMARVVGGERALAIHEEVTEIIAPIMMKNTFPSTDEIKRLGNPFHAFRKYMVSVLSANRDAGIHEFKVIEDSDEAIAFDITYCAFAEIPKQLGAPEAGIPNCYSDEVFFPSFLRPLGMRFVRNGTIARGNRVCDFRFERVGAT